MDLPRKRRKHLKEKLFMPNKLGASLRRNIMPTIKFDDFLKEQLKDPKFKARFEKESANLESAIVIAKAREAAGLTQRDLAEKSGVPQSTIARIEQGANTSISTLCKIAFALDKQVKISLV